MLRRWTTEEIKILREYINTHLGHRDGLKGVYWSGLCLALAGVRRDDDTALEKHQVTNKIISFRKRQASCSYILEYGTSEDRVITPSGPEDPASGTNYMTMNTISSKLTVIEENSVGHQSPLRDNEIISDLEEKDTPHNSSTLLLCPETTFDFRSTPSLQDQLRGHTVPSPHFQSEVCSDVPQSRERNKSSYLKSISDKKGSKKSHKKSRDSRAKRKRSRYEESLREEIEKEELMTQMSVREVPAGCESPVAHHGHEFGAAQETCISREQPAHSELAFEDAGGPPWQEFMFDSWQNHLIFQDVLSMPQSEPPSHRDVSYIFESVSRHLNEACVAIQRMFPHQWSFSCFGSSFTKIPALLTGCREHHKATDVLRISQSLTSSSKCTNMLEALMGATIHVWIFEGLPSSMPSLSFYEPVRNSLDHFIEQECPKLWMSYQNLYRLHHLSSYTAGRITTEAEKLASDAYTLLSAVCLSQTSTHNTQVNKSNSMTVFAAQTQYYQAFKTNMTLAYQLSLELSITFAKCCDLVYDFRFPKIQEKFDPSCMEARGSGMDGSQNDTSTTADEDQLVVVGLLPAIWSRKRNGSDVEQAWTLVSKAVVLL